VGATSPDVVAVEARRIAEAAQASTRAQSASELASPAGNTDQDAAGGAVVSLTQRRLADSNVGTAGTVGALPLDRRPAPSVEAYDELLLRRRSIPTAAVNLAGATADQGPDVETGAS
jgi:hypothetical protein